MVQPALWLHGQALATHLHFRRLRAVSRSHYCIVQITVEKKIRRQQAGIKCLRRVLAISKLISLILKNRRSFRRNNRRQLTQRNG
jgi:hypothetical protein